MGKKQVLGKYHRLFALFGCGVSLASFNLHRQRQACQLRERQPGIAVKRQWHQCGTGFHHAQPKLLGDAVAKVSGANLGDRQSTCGNDDLRRFYQTPVSINLIAACAHIT